jgi:hypothetical protein
LQALGILIGLCYTNIALNQRGVQDITGAAFAFVTENTFPSLFGILGTLPLELPLIFREHQGGMFCVSSYYLAKAVAIVSLNRTAVINDWQYGDSL